MFDARSLRVKAVATFACALRAAGNQRVRSVTRGVVEPRDSFLGCQITHSSEPLSLYVAVALSHSQPQSSSRPENWLLALFQYDRCVVFCHVFSAVVPMTPVPTFSLWILLPCVGLWWAVVTPGQEAGGRSGRRQDQSRGGR